jgi:transcriptional regulator GlxA family with amidase domain
MTHRIDVFVFPDFQLLDFSGPVAAFEMAARLVPRAYAMRPVAVVPGTVRSSAGVDVLAEDVSADPADTVLVTGGIGTRNAVECARSAAFLRGADAAGSRIASVCSGAFLLAAAGVLAHRRATTHWSLTAAFARRFPDIVLEPDRIFTRDGRYWTSAGITAGIDLALAMIAHDLGDRVARDVARQLVVPYRRSGGQSQFSSFLDVQRDGRFGALLDWAREHLAEPLTINQLADRAAMSPRHFARAFKRETGVTPAKAIERLRLAAAQVRIEAGRESMEVVASVTGFGDSERMRRAFVRALGQPPQALRRLVRADA